MEELIGLSQPINNVSFITVLFFFIPGYFALLLSRFLLRINNGPQYNFNRIDKWDIIIWCGLYSGLAYVIVNLLNQLVLTLKFSSTIENRFVLFIFYILAIATVGTLDSILKKYIHKSESGYYSIAEEINRHYSKDKNKSVVKVKLKNGEIYKGLFRGIDYSNASKSFIEIGSFGDEQKNDVPIKRIDKKIITINSKSVFFNLSEVESLFFDK